MIGENMWFFVIWRYLFYGLIVTLWPRFIRCIGKQQGWAEEMVDYFSEQRFKVFGFCVMVELFFVMNVVGHLLSGFNR